MRLFWKTIFFLLAVIFILIGHVFVINFLPFPYNRLNIIFSILIFLLITRQGRQAVWLALILSYCIDLLSAVPFGIGQVSLITSLLAINWFQLTILTNRSGYIIFILTFFAVILYRAIFFFTLITYNYFISNPILPGKTILIDTVWETIFSASAVYITYTIYSKFIKKLARKRFD